MICSLALRGAVKHWKRSLVTAGAVAVSCAVMIAIGSLLNGVNSSFLESVVHALGASAGFLLAIVLMAGIRERIEISQNMPRCLRGLPIALVTAGLMSIAFMGFSGLIK